MSAAEANRLASSKNLDLVKINPQVNPPVCKIMDYGKFKFEASKRDKELKKASKNVLLREMTLSMNIDKHDLDTKARKTVEMLAEGDKVKITLRMRGREQAHARLGVEKLQYFYSLCESVSTIDLQPKTEGRNIIMILMPIKKVEAGGGKKNSQDKKLVDKDTHKSDKQLPVESSNDTKVNEIENTTDPNTKEPKIAQSEANAKKAELEAKRALARANKTKKNKDNDII